MDLVHLFFVISNSVRYLVRLGYVRVRALFGQVSQVRLGQVRLSGVRLGQKRNKCVRYSPCRSWVWAEGPNPTMQQRALFGQSACTIRLECVRYSVRVRALFGQVTLGQVRLGQVRLSGVRLGQKRKVRVRALFELQKLGLGRRPKPNFWTASAESFSQSACAIVTARSWVWAKGPNPRMPEQLAFEAPNVLLGQVRLGQVRLGQVRLGQVISYGPFIITIDSRICLNFVNNDSSHK